MRVTKVMGKKSKDTNQTRSGIALNAFEIYESDKEETGVEKYLVDHLVDLMVTNNWWG